MSANADFKLNAFKETLNLPDFDGFMEVLQTSIDELSRHTPHDGSLTVDVHRLGGGYKIAIQLVSSVFNFFESAEGRSPFFALEKVLLKANQALKVWSIHRRF